MTTAWNVCGPDTNPIVGSSVGGGLFGRDLNSSKRPGEGCSEKKKQYSEPTTHPNRFVFLQTKCESVKLFVIFIFTNYSVWKLHYRFQTGVKASFLNSFPFRFRWRSGRKIFHDHIPHFGILQHIDLKFIIETMLP